MANGSNYGVFLPLTAVFDTTTIDRLDLTGQDFREFLVLQTQAFNNISRILNLKETGYYLPVEIVNGQQWFTNSSVEPTRACYTTVVNFGTLPNAAAKSVAHGIVGISANTTFTTMYGAASNTAAQLYKPIPYVNLVANNSIQLDVDATNVTITTGIDYTAYTTCYVVLKYLKN